MQSDPPEASPVRQQLKFHDNEPTNNPDTKFPIKIIKKIHVNEQIENRRKSLENFFNESINFNHATFSLKDILMGVDSQPNNPSITVHSNPTGYHNQSANLDLNNKDNLNSSNLSNPEYFDPYANPANPQQPNPHIYPSQSYQKTEKSKEKNKLINNFYNKKLTFLDDFEKNIQDQGKATFLMSNSSYLDQDNFKGIADGNYKTLSSITRLFNNKLKIALTYSQRISYYKNVEVELNAQIRGLNIEKERQDKRKAEDIKLRKFLESVKVYEMFYDKFMGFRFLKITRDNIDNTMLNLGITIRNEVTLN